MDSFLDFLRNAFLVLWFFAFFAFAAFLLLIPLAAFAYTIVDVLNRDDIAGAKLLWILVVLLVPLIGLAIYWLSKPSSEQVTAPPTALRQTTPAADTGQETDTRRAA